MFKKISVLAIAGALLMTAAANGQTEGKKGKRKPRSGDRPDMAQLVQKLDKNRDGKLSADEIPERMAARMEKMDTNGDGSLDKKELAKLAQRRRGGANQDGGPPKRPGTDRNTRRGGPDRFNMQGLLKKMDRNNDGVLDQAEQKALVEQFKEFQEKMRAGGGQMRDGKRRGANGKGKGKPQNGGDRRRRPNTDPVKPKRPGGGS